MIDINGDIHTEYLSAEELAAFEQGLNSNFVGIGVQYYNIDGYNIVERVLPNSPAQRAGVWPVGTSSTPSMVKASSERIRMLYRTWYVVMKIPSSTSTLNVVKPIVSLRITRGPVLSSAYGEMVGEDIGYLEISSFSLQTGEEVKYYLEEMANLGATKLIIDVRDNGGGYLSTLNQIASFFLEEEGYRNH